MDNSGRSFLASPAHNFLILLKHVYPRRKMMSCKLTFRATNPGWVVRMCLPRGLEPEAKTLVAWASGKPFVRRLWVYGSRAGTSARSDSDLDVALEVDPIGNDEDALTSFVDECSGWEAELQPQLRHRLHLEWYDPLGTNVPVRDGVHESGILIYERTT